MVTRIILNETSYHGAGAVQSITAELAARDLTVKDIEKLYLSLI